VRFFLVFILLFFICYPAEEKTLSLCEISIDSLFLPQKVERDYYGNIIGSGYVDGHCLDSEKSLLLYKDLK